MARDIEFPERESVWAVAGNVIGERAYGPGSEDTRSGTRLFRAGAKIYLASLRHAWVFSQEPINPPDEAIQVIGQHRTSRSWLMSWMRFRDTTDWRVQVIHNPAVLKRLHAEEWPGFLLEPREFSRADGEPALQSVRSLISLVDERGERRWRARWLAQSAPSVADD